MGRWVRVYASPKSLQAQLALAALEGAGIPAQLLGGDRVPGAFGVDFQVEVLVPDDLLDDAREVLGLPKDGTGGELSIASLEGGNVALAEAPHVPTFVTCPECGADWEPGFEVCWSCDYAGSPDSSASTGSGSPPRSSNR